MADINDIALSFDPNLAISQAFGSYGQPGPSLNIAPYLTAAGGGMRAGADFMAGRDTSALLSANASIAGMQARSERETGAEQAEIYRTHLAQRMGLEAAQIGGSNVTASGSALRKTESTAALGAQDISRIQLNAARKAWGFQTTQAGDELRAGLASRGGASNAFGQLITSGAKAYGQWSSGD